MASQSQDDSGVVYVNEHGTLRCVTGRDGNMRRLPPSKRMRHSLERIQRQSPDSDILPADEPKCCNGELQQPKALLYLTMDFVIQHVTMVDSFVGFPAQIGRRLFTLAQQHGTFKDINVQCKAMRLFCDAYEQEVLECLNLHNQYFALNQCVDQLLPFIHLSRLDVSNCELGSDHEFLMNISNMVCLKCLNLSKNCLTNSCIQRLTTRPRMFHTGPVNLQYLNLSGNPQLSDHVVVFLLVFKVLEFLDMSGTRLSVDVGIAQFERATNLRYLKQNTRLEVDEMKIETSGWASAIVNDWIQSSLQRQRKPQIANHYIQYKRKKISEELKKIIPQRKLTVTPTIMQLASLSLMKSLACPEEEDAKEACGNQINMPNKCKQYSSEVGEKIKTNSSVVEPSCAKKNTGAPPRNTETATNCQEFDKDEMKLLQSYSCSSS